MKKYFGVKCVLLALGLLCSLMFFSLPSFAWESSADGVTLYSSPQYDSDDWYYGDDIYCYNGNSFPVFVNVHMTEYDNIQFSVGGSVGQGETRKIGWIVCADSSQGWYYNLDWGWEEEYRAF